jgi:hypothetical protein
MPELSKFYTLLLTVGHLNTPDTPQDNFIPSLSTPLHDDMLCRLEMNFNKLRFAYLASAKLDGDFFALIFMCNARWSF